MKKKKKNLLTLLVLFILTIIPTITAFASLKSNTIGLKRNFVESDSTKTYEIIANLDGGKFNSGTTPEFIQKDTNNWVHNYKPIATEITLPTPIKNGYEFIGWSSDENPNINKTFVIPKWNNKNINVKANWKSSNATLITGPTFNSTISNMPNFANVTEIRFVKETPNPNGINVAIEGEAKAYIEENILKIASTGEIFANPNIETMFNGLNNISKITFDNFNTSKTTNMRLLFNDCEKLTNIIGLDKFDTSNVTNMSGLFKTCSNLTSIDLTNFNTNKVTTIDSMFMSCTNLTTINISSFNTSNMTDISKLFTDCNKLTNIDLSNFNTSNVTNMSYMFNNCSLLTNININNWDTTNVTDMSGMFYNCNKLNGEITIRNTNTKYNGTHEDDKMFAYCSLDNNAKFIVKYKDSATKETARNMVNTKNTEDHVYLYEPAKSGLLPGGEFFNKLTKIPNLNTATEIRFINGTPKTGIDLSLAQNGSITGYVENGITYIASENIIEFNPDSSGMFAAPRPCLNRLKKISFNNIDTTKVKTMASMFAGPWRDNTWRLEEITGLTLFKTPNLENMSSMFNNCYYLKSADLSSFETSNVNDMQALFAECHSITNIDVSNFNTRKNRYFNAMFSECYNLPNLDLSNFRFDNAEMTGYMLATCNMIKTTITINNPNIRFYDSTLAWSAVEGDAKITVNYTAGCRDMAQTIIDTTEGINDGCYIVLGTQVPDRSPTDKSIFKNTNLTEKITLFFNKFE